jgi:glucose/arabinose dehydrogenase
MDRDLKRAASLQKLRALAALAALTGAGLDAAAGTAPQPYVTQTTTCDGWPRVDVGMAPGFCMGLVVAPPENGFHRRLLRTPRMLLELPDKKSWLLSDLGAWTDKLGKIWLLTVDAPGEVRLREVIGGLALPHTLTRGPDGGIYGAEMNRIFRIDPRTFAATTVIDGLPGNRLHLGRHPLSHFLFDANGDLLVNVGADTDQCADAASRLPGEESCPEAEGSEARAVLRRYAYLGGGRWNPTPAVLARGLRNSLVLLRHSSGTLLQAENSYDFAPLAERPYDEINVIKPGANYGWPYCYDLDQRTPAWAAAAKVLDCASAAHEKPVVLLPPHAAPLGAVYYAGAMFPALDGKLLMSWHGYRPTGSRVVAFAVDAHGVPTITPDAHYPEYAGGATLSVAYRSGPAAEPLVLTPRWDLVPGVRPAGAPVALTIADDGAIWVADDRNAAILRIAADRP